MSETKIDQQEQDNQDTPLYQQNDGSRPMNTLPNPLSLSQPMRSRTGLFSTETGPYFSPNKPMDNLYASDKQTLLSVRLESKMDKGFFLAENDWTCYRRNYFQVSGVFSIHGFNHYYSMNEPHVLYVKENNMLFPVHRFMLGISAKVTNGPKEIDLIQHTPKRDKGPQFKPFPQPIVPGGNLSMSSVANSQNIVTFQRIQFKTATANNGKRRAAQQYYSCTINLFVETDRSELIKIASCQSAPLVVRGRSPGHYADNLEHRHHTKKTNTHDYPHQKKVMVTKPVLKPSSTPTTGPHKDLPVYSKPYPQDIISPTHYDHPNPQQQPQQPQDYHHPYPYYPQYQQQPQPQSQPPSNYPPIPPYYVHPDQPYDKMPYLPQNDWQRARYNSASTGSSSVPSPQPQEQPHFNFPQDRPYHSPTTPTQFSYQHPNHNQNDQKFNNVPNLIK